MFFWGTPEQIIVGIQTHIMREMGAGSGRINSS
jgi:hypothetical protein